MLKHKKAILAFAIVIPISVFIIYLLLHNVGEMRRFKKYEDAFNLVNNAVIQDYMQSDVNGSKTQTYFIDFNDNTIYKNVLLQNKEVDFINTASLDKIQNFYPYPFECIYVTEKQVEYVYAEGFASVVYVKKGFYPKCDFFNFDTNIGRLGSKWYSVEISN